MTQIQGRVFFNNLGLGAWGIEVDAKTRYRPLQFPEQLKYEGLEVQCTIEQTEEAFSVHMWGIPCRIIQFVTPLPKD